MSTLLITSPFDRQSNDPEGRYGRGDSVDQYVIEELLASHGVVEIYSARNPKNEQVALKIFYVVGQNEARDLCSNEIRVATKLQHPNILEIIDCEFGPNQFYLVTPYYPAGTLADWLRTHCAELEDVFAIFYQLVLALQCAHGRGIAHGDLKPENIFMASDDPPVIKIADWESAALASVRLNLKRLGTPQYAAPEQLLGSTPTWESDMYSVAVIMAEVITGIRLFEVAANVWPMRRNAPDLRLMNKLARAWKVPVLSHLIHELLSEAPSRRYPAIKVFEIIEPLVHGIRFQPPRERQITK